ncbi:MAG: PAS domain S-box protein [Acetobacteraceae bacterium]|nr:MAG: PAS domain S-box protein [Acetobacteraceae bacterium]
MTPSSVGRGRRWGLSTYLIAFGLALLLPVLALGAVSAWQVAQAYQGAFAGRLRDTARALSLALDAEFEILQAAAMAVASAPAVQDQRDDAMVRAWLDGLGKALDDARIAIVAERDAPADASGALVRQIIGSGKPGVSNLYERQPGGALAVSVGVPIPSPGPSNRVVLVTIDPLRLATVLTAQRLTAGVAGLADGQGVNVARSRGNDRFVGAPAPWYGMATGLQEGVFQGRNFEGVEILFGFRRLNQGEGWGVVIGEPLAAYKASWQPPLLRLGIGAVLAIALAIGAAAVLARRVLAPVRALRRQAEDVATVGTAGAEVRAAVATAAPVAEFEALRLALLRADSALRSSAAEFRTAFEQAAIAMFQAEPATGLLLRVNAAFCALVGRPGAELIGRPFLDFIVVEERAAIAQSWVRMTSGAMPVLDMQTRTLRPDGETRWVSGSISPIRDPGTGMVARTLAALQDTTERKAAEERQLLMTRELDHRAKNVLAVVQAALRLTPRTDAAEYAKAVEGRIAALARAHTLLAQARWAGADLRAVVEAELTAFLSDTASATRVVLEGPVVTLSPAAVQALSMALHELATNATKHGALAVPGGDLQVSWSVAGPSLASGPGRLLFRWVERGGPAVEGPPSRRGFGSRVLQATMRDQLGGQVEQFWLPAGLECSITLPLDRIS